MRESCYHDDLIRSNEIDENRPTDCWLRLIMFDRSVGGREGDFSARHKRQNVVSGILLLAILLAVVSEEVWRVGFHCR